jgi:hypothetical protein
MIVLEPLGIRACGPLGPPTVGAPLAPKAYLAIENSCWALGPNLEPRCNHLRVCLENDLKKGVGC